MSLICRNAGLGMLILSLACSSDLPSANQRRSLTIQPSPVSGCVLDTVAFTAKLDGNPVSSAALRWTTDSVTVLSIDAGGVARAIGVGTAHVMASLLADTSTTGQATFFVAPDQASAPSIGALYQSGTTQRIAPDSLRGAVDVVIAVPTIPGCLSWSFDGADLMIGSNNGGAVGSIVASTPSGQLTAGKQVTLTINTAASVSGAPAYPDGSYAIWVVFHHHGTSGKDVSSARAAVSIRN